MNKFKLEQKVKHIKTGGVYVISSVPRETCRLENCNESFYSYIQYDLVTGDVAIEWLRCTSEMEDGRFEAL